jgi:CDP-diacylglycerol--serine O-phosphatidyltransferase
MSAETTAGRAWWRVVIPNAVTSVSIVFGVLSIVSAVEGRPVSAAWWALYCTLTDRLDGALARALDGGTAFGVQLDSLADLLGFGIAPAAAVYAFYVARPELGWSAGAARGLLTLFAFLWVYAAAVRLARYNVRAAEGSVDHYTGTPTTMTAGTILSLVLACWKYADPQLALPESLDQLHLLGPLDTTALVPHLPWLLVVGAVGMVSPLRVPRLGLARGAGKTAILIASLVGFGVGLLRTFPEYLAGGGLTYLALSVRYHLRTRSVAT